jgi:signal transduction histidine kinase
MAQEKGFTIFCDEKGLIRRVVKDNTGIFDQAHSGKLIYTLLDVQSRSVFLDFLKEVKERSMAFNYQAVFITNKAPVACMLAGILLDSEILIISSDPKSETFELINQIQMINNEQSNTIRRLIKEKFEIERNKKEEDNRIYNDLTGLNNDLVNLQRELAKKNTELAHLNDLKNKFLGMAAHDLRNPIGIIFSYSEFLIEETKETLSAEHREFLNIINSSAQFMLTLIDDLLDISRIESGKIELHTEPLPVLTLMSKIVSLNKILSHKKHIEISLVESEPGLSIIADASKMEQVFNNLISNAIKFSLQGTTIRVELSAKENYAIIAVHDQGQGIPEEEMDKLFKPFQKTSVKSTEGEKSTGLGLSIAKRIVEAHKGSIRVESTVGSGTSFYVSIPLSKVSPGSAVGQSGL